MYACTYPAVSCLLLDMCGVTAWIFLCVSLHFSLKRHARSIQEQASKTKQNKRRKMCLFGKISCVLYGTTVSLHMLWRNKKKVEQRRKKKNVILVPKQIHHPVYYRSVMNFPLELSILLTCAMANISRCLALAGQYTFYKLVQKGFDVDVQSM